MRISCNRIIRLTPKMLFTFPPGIFDATAGQFGMALWGQDEDMSSGLHKLLQGPFLICQREWSSSTVEFASSVTAMLR